MKHRLSFLLALLAMLSPGLGGCTSIPVASGLPDQYAVFPGGTPGLLKTHEGLTLYSQWWKPAQVEPRAVVILLHGTGDLAVMDDAGDVSIVGRIKDMVIRGGENIYPREIAEFLYTHRDIRDVQVIGVPDATFGEEVMACVILKEGAAPLTPETLRAFFRERAIERLGLSAVRRTTG